MRNSSPPEDERSNPGITIAVRIPAINTAVTRTMAYGIHCMEEDMSCLKGCQGHRKSPHDPEPKIPSLRLENNAWFRQASGYMRRRVISLVGFNDVLHQLVAHNIFFSQLYKPNTIDARQETHRLL